MNKREFLEALSKTPRDWYLTNSGRIRRPGKSGYLECPISSLRGRESGAWGLVALDVGIDTELRLDIVAAADSTSFWDRLLFGRMRRAIVKACGLR